MGNFFFFSHITFIVFLPQTLWKGSLSALPAVGAAGSGIRLGNESASIEAPFCRFQEHGTTWDHSCSPRSSSSPPVHLAFAGGIQRPLSSCTNHQQLPAHPGSSECCSPTYNNTFDIFIAFLTFILFPFFFLLFPRKMSTSRNFRWPGSCTTNTFSRIWFSPNRSYTAVYRHSLHSLGKTSLLFKGRLYD